MTPRGRHVLLYDGWCCFCENWARRARRLDFKGRIEVVDLRTADLAAIDPRLTKEACESKVHLVERGGRISAGFGALKRLSLLLPALWPAAPLLHVPGIDRIGEPAYEALARLRLRPPGPR